MVKTKMDMKEKKVRVFGIGEALAVIAVICISLGVVYQRAAAIHVNAIVGSFINIIPVFLTGLIYLWISSRNSRSTFGKPTRLAIVAGVGGALSANMIGLPIFLKALSIGGAVIVTPIVASSVIWASILARIMIGQRLSKYVYIGFGVFVAGMILLMAGQLHGIPLSAKWYFAVPLALAVAILYGVTMSLTGYSLANGLSESGSVAINGISSLAGLGILVIIQHQPISIFQSDSYKLILAGILQAAGLIASTAAFAKTTVVSVSTILVTNIIWTSLLTWAILGDTLNPMMAIALGIALCGLIIVQYSRSKRS
jgi:drug/metabolite transporter (DMT)-like permease